MSDEKPSTLELVLAALLYLSGIFALLAVVEILGFIKV